MTTNSFLESSLIRRFYSFAFLVSGLSALIALTGCQTPQYKDLAATPHIETIILREGDVLNISFPGANNFDTSQQVRRDGKIVLRLAGELKVVGLTPAELEKEIIKVYEPQVALKEVTVSVASSSFPVFVAGAVVRPGKITSDHPITALEAIMEAGGFNYTTANLKAVKVIRREENRVRNFKLNLKRVLDKGSQEQPFYLKPSDIVYIPEKFSWF